MKYTKINQFIEKHIDTYKSCTSFSYYFNESFGELVTPKYKGKRKLYDGVTGIIDLIGKKLSNMPEDTRPARNIVLIFTNGEDQGSCNYTKEQLEEIIKNQQDVYSWEIIIYKLPKVTYTYPNINCFMNNLKIVSNFNKPDSSINRLRVNQNSEYGNEYLLQLRE